MPDRSLAGRAAAPFRVGRTAQETRDASRTIQDKRIRIRPVDGGLKVDLTAELIEPKYSPAMRDTYYFRNELRKSFGGEQIGTDFAHAVMWVGLWTKLDQVKLPVAITTKDVLYFSGGAWKYASPANLLSGTTTKPVSVVFFNDVMYFGSYDYELRSWDGSSSHAAVSGGNAFKTIETLNNRLLMGNIISNGVAYAQQVKWSQNGTATFSGTGSGSQDLVDRDDEIRVIKKMGPFRGFVYKAESIVEARATGEVTSPFEFSEKIGGFGILCPSSIVHWARGHMFIATDEEIYNFDGSNLDNIGKDIRDELFPLLNPSLLDKVVAGYTRDTQEYLVVIPSVGETENSLFYAFDPRRRRWRSGRYPNVTSIGSYSTALGLSWDEAVGSWDAQTKAWNEELGTASRQSVIVGTTTKRVFKLTEGVHTFDGSALQFEYSTGDVVGENDGDELTLLEVIVGYIVDGTAALTVDASVDRGASFEGAVAADLGGGSLVSGDIQYVHVPMLVTGDNIRARLRNSNSAHVIRIVSITLRLSIATESSRSESTR